MLSRLATRVGERLVACALQLMFAMTRGKQRATWWRRSASQLGWLFGAMARKLTPAAVPVSAVILARMTAVSPQETVGDVADLMVGDRVARVPVVDGGKAVGVVTRDSLNGALTETGPHTPVGLLTLREAIEVGPHDALEDVLEQLRRSPGAVALVIDRGATVGMVTEEQLEMYLAGQAA